MGFSVSFQLKSSARLHGVLSYMCVLKCTNLMFSDTVTVALTPSDGSQPWYFKDLKFGPGTQYEFSYDTVDWMWCQDDVISVLDKNGKVLESWRFHKTEYGPGECPDCHGTKRCRACHGQAFIFNSRTFDSSLDSMTCQKCGGTGICQTCDIPYRARRSGGGPTGLKPF